MYKVGGKYEKFKNNLDVDYMIFFENGIFIQIFRTEISEKLKHDVDYEKIKYYVTITRNWIFFIMDVCGDLINCCFNIIMTEGGYHTKEFFAGLLQSRIGENLPVSISLINSKTGEICAMRRIVLNEKISHEILTACEKQFDFYKIDGIDFVKIELNEALKDNDIQFLIDHAVESDTLPSIDEFVDSMIEQSTDEQIELLKILFDSMSNEKRGD